MIDQTGHLKLHRLSSYANLLMIIQHHELDTLFQFFSVITIKKPKIPLRI